MNFKKKINEAQGSFQLAPMVDVMFLLLIFFMVSSIYYQLEKNLEVKVPRAESGVESVRQVGEIIINVSKEGKYYVNNIEMNIAGIEEVLKDIVKKFNRSQPIIIRCDQDCPHKYFVKVFDICQTLEIEDVRIATQPEELPDPK